MLGAIRFNDEGAEDRARHLHAVLVDSYTGKQLVGINTRQNQPLPLLTEGNREPATVSKRDRILFLGANSLASPMDLEREVRKIDDAGTLAAATSRGRSLPACVPLLKRSLDELLRKWVPPSGSPRMRVTFLPLDSHQTQVRYRLDRRKLPRLLTSFAAVAALPGDRPR